MSEGLGAPTDRIAWPHQEEGQLHPVEGHYHGCRGQGRVDPERGPESRSDEGQKGASSGGHEKPEVERRAPSEKTARGLDPDETEGEGDTDEPHRGGPRHPGRSCRRAITH